MSAILLGALLGAIASASFLAKHFTGIADLIVIVIGAIAGAILGYKFKG